MKTQQEHREIAQTILMQFGGGKFVAMTGARHFCADDSGLSFRLPQGFAKSGINHVQVVLTPQDDYNLIFGKQRAGKYTPLEKIEGVYADQLQETFTSKTGLHVRL